MFSLLLNDFWVLFVQENGDNEEENDDENSNEGDS